MSAAAIYHLKCNHALIATGDREAAESVVADLPDWGVREATDDDLLVLISPAASCSTCRLAVGDLLQALVADRRHRRPHDLPSPDEEIDVAFMPGATINAEQAIADMRKQTHDGLIDLLGRRRRSAIRWRQVDGRAECERFLRDMYAPDGGVVAKEGPAAYDPEKWAGVQQHYFPFLAEHGDNAVLVIAECEAVR